MSYPRSSGRCGWTITDRVVTVVLMLAQCAILLYLWLPSSDSAFNVALGGAIFVGAGIVAIGGPVVIAVTAVLVLRAIDRGRASFPIPVAGILVLIVLYIFPIMIVSVVAA